MKGKIRIRTEKLYSPVMKEREDEDYEGGCDCECSNCYCCSVDLKEETGETYFEKIMNSFQENKTCSFRMEEEIKKGESWTIFTFQDKR